MKTRKIAAIACLAMTIAACDEDTSTIGSTLTTDSDIIAVTTGSFGITTRTLVADSVLSKNKDCYFGDIIDPETGTRVKSEFMTQFNMTEALAMPEKSTIATGQDGDIVADSCVIYMLFDRSSCYGDTLTAMKMRVSELNQPVEDKIYYTDFDPRKEGYVRESGLTKNQMFTISDLTVKDSIRNLGSNYYNDRIRIKLDDEYTDKEGNSYDNFGTYIIRNYYAHPEYFKNSYSFIHNVCPGLLFESADGVGLMARFSEIDLLTYFNYTIDDSTYYSVIVSSSTEEVVQTTKVTNDKQAIRELADDSSCTYMKTPAGLFTEVELPIDEITANHENDSLLSAKIVFHRLNNKYATGSNALNVPSTILMVQKDSLYTFFEKNKVYDNTSSFTTALANNAYTFSNIANLITFIHRTKAEQTAIDPNWTALHPDWNKVVLVPITTTSSNTSIGNELGLTTTRLEKEGLTIDIVYAKFKD